MRSSLSVSAGIQRLIRGFKSLSQLFVIYEEDDEGDENDEIEMEIGLPTDVQHVAHIGWDGFNNSSSSSISTIGSMKSWDQRGGPPPPQLLPLPSLSLSQLEMAMEAQAAGHGGPLGA